MNETSSVSNLRPLVRLRARLTIWYGATLGAILLTLGVGLFLAIRSQISSQLDQSLDAAVREIVSAAHIREIESAAVSGPVMDAVEELHIPDRQLFLLDTAGTPLTPKEAPDWIRAAARSAPTEAGGTYQREAGEGHTLRAHAQRFALKSGAPLVAIALADDIELEDRYADLIAAFSAAAALALVLVAFGGWILVRQSTHPVEITVQRMRQFMADAAHELRTPITVLRTRAEVTLQQPRTPDAYISAMRSIENESQRLGAIVDQLLLLARADSGELPLRRELVYLDDVALDAASAVLPVAQRKGIELSIPTFDEAPLLGDTTLIRRLVVILLDNALKFTPSGGSVSVRALATPNGAELTVSDTGPGIPPEQLPKVFDRFFRGDAARTKGDGAGLGLSIAQWIVREHGGTIAISSIEGSGTHVTARFPSSA